MNKLSHAIKESSPPFANELIGNYMLLHQNPVDLKYFAVEEKWNDCATIDIFGVKGTAHPDYCDLTWKELLATGKRMGTNLDLLDSNPDYYTSREKKIPSMSYERIDNELYLAGDGNHRTCIGRFYLSMIGETFLHGVDLKEFKIDKSAVSALVKAKKLLRTRGFYYVEPINYREKISREDAPGWHIEKFNVRIELINRINGKKHEIISANSDPIIEVLENWGFSQKMGLKIPEILKK